MRDGEDYVIAASRAGAPSNPAWYHNRLAHSRVQIEVGVDGEITTLEATAVHATGAERTRLWGELVASEPRFGEYQTKTDRVIPVLVLTALGRD